MTFFRIPFHTNTLTFLHLCNRRLKVALPSIFGGTPSIFELLRLKQIFLYCKTIITRVLQIDLTFL